MGDKLNTREVAKHFGVSLYQVNYAISTRRLKAKKWGHIYTIDSDDLPDRWPVLRRGRRRRGE